jgi:hypothetical protein
VSGWRAGLVAAAVGGLILLIGALVGVVGNGDGSASTTAAPPGAVDLACVPALEAVCADLATSLGLGTRSYQPGVDPGEAVVVIAPAADLPAGMSGPVVARSPIAVAVWRERALVLAPSCGGTVGPACLEGAYGAQWGDLGGHAAWGGFKLGLADPTRSESGLAAWRVVAAAGVPAGLEASLRLVATDDGALMLELAQFGASRADAVVATEVAIARQLENVQDVGRLEVYYPDPGPWVEYVAAGRGGDAGRAAERLLTAEVQSRLPALGLRPASGEASGLPEGLGAPGQPLGPLGAEERAALIAAWQGL